MRTNVDTLGRQTIIVLQRTPTPHNRQAQRTHALKATEKKRNKAPKWKSSAYHAVLPDGLTGPPKRCSLGVVRRDGLPPALLFSVGFQAKNVLGLSPVFYRRSSSSIATIDHSKRYVAT